MSSDIAISIENVSKSYRLGVIGHGTLREDMQSWWAHMRGKPDPNSRVGASHHAIEGHTLWALQDISLEVKKGEVLGIIGRNGAGKSTLLKILSRVTAPTSGEIKVHGRVASLLEVGTGFHPELTGRENIFLNGAILGMTKSEVARKFDEIVAFSEIEEFIDTPVKRYSSGMYVRLAFAVAAHLDPEILVVDEVLAVGDAAFQKKCLGKMGDVAKEGRTVLFVSHNMGAIRNLCSQAAVLRHGRMVFLGNVHEAVDSYLGNEPTDAHMKLVVTDAIRAKGYSKSVEFESIAFDSCDNAFASDEPIRFIITVNGNQNVNDCRINATISTMDEIPIGGVSSTMFFPVQKDEKKTLVFSIFDHRLAVGNYKISLSLGTGNYTTKQQDFDVVMYALAFHINCASKENKTGFAEWHSNWGNVMFCSSTSEYISATSDAHCECSCETQP